MQPSLYPAQAHYGEEQPSIQAVLSNIETELQKGWIAVAEVDPDNKINKHSNHCGDDKEWFVAAY